jgi:hypothetical protein
MWDNFSYFIAGEVTVTLESQVRLVLDGATEVKNPPTPFHLFASSDLQDARFEQGQQLVKPLIAADIYMEHTYAFRVCPLWFTAQSIDVAFARDTLETGIVCAAGS